MCEIDDVAHAESVCVENLDVLALDDNVKKTEIEGVVVLVAIADFDKIPTEAVERVVRVLEVLTDTDLVTDAEEVAVGLIFEERVVDEVTQGVGVEDWQTVVV